MAYYFNGTSSELFFNDFTVMNSGDWTIGAWVRADAVGSQPMVFCAATSGNFIRQTLNLNSASREWRAVQNGATAAQSIAAVGSNAIHTLGVWQVVFATFSILDSKCRLYVGDLSTPIAECNNYATQTTLVTRSTGGSWATLGHGVPTSVQRWEGHISSVFADPHEWTRAEMEHFRHTNIPRFTDNGSGSTAMRGWWPLLSNSNEYVRGLTPFTATDLAQTAEPPMRGLVPRRIKRLLAA